MYESSRPKHHVLPLTIIFSTVCRVSGSRSVSLLFSGSTAVTSMAGSEVSTLSHQRMPSTLVSVNSTTPSTGRQEGGGVEGGTGAGQWWMIKLMQATRAEWGVLH